MPITLPPAQVPKIVSAGIALSPYTRNPEVFRHRTPEKIPLGRIRRTGEGPKDAYFARVLAYAPDQLLSNNNPSLFVAPDEPALPIDPEYIRVITPDQSHDEAGIDAMQPMEKAKDSDRHYLLPLPPGLHSESPELFGFFTYEFRIGHYKYRIPMTGIPKARMSGPPPRGASEGLCGQPVSSIRPRRSPAR